ncbi:hypothetical protein EST38_g5302 [Candolleomyces aberdarensis]|uniref:Uncharacterized protein n=1 Tax=Candolleomyces aberdarensis TaxID=2316362 RepID=A0A4Q2DMV5_9AGAR|nr:hypothetical protein EST38_g5302 [Candolleomyces aberdarensis]
MSVSASLDLSITHPVPGLGKPLDYIPTEDDPLYVGPPLATALLPVCEEMWQSSEHELESDEKNFIPITTVRELSMLRFMSSVTDKPEWDQKIFDADIVKKWRTETVDNPDVNMTNLMFDHCIAELEDFATELLPERKHRAIVVYDGNVVKSDDAVPSTVKLALQDAVKFVEDVPDKLKDWHPGSDKKVLDLVHPSLFPLIYGRTKVLKIGEKVVGLHDCVSRCGEGEVLRNDADNPPEANTKPRGYNSWNRSAHVRAYSLKYQWLPCEVDISGQDGARIVSYINNLHPSRHSDLYGLVEKVIDAAIPLWELTLAPLYDQKFYYRRRLSCYPNYDFRESGDEEGVDEDDDYYREIVIQPEPGPFIEFRKRRRTPKAINFAELYGKQGRPLQVIVKLANIELTPEKPSYEGGSWHVEGQQNEHIVATALYYYSCHNIKSSHLAFRQFVSVREVEGMHYYDQNPHFLHTLFGCNNYSGGVQDVGSVETREGRLLTFPNILQHQVQPFELEDPTKSGHRKILALFLVDPNIRTLSTAYVPSQYLDWWQELATAELGKLPLELRDQVFGGIEEFPIKLDEAKEIRLELMEERKNFVLDHIRTVNRMNEFSLCEH